MTHFTVWYTTIHTHKHVYVYVGKGYNNYYLIEVFNLILSQRECTQ